MARLTRAYISEATGFDSGDLFETEEQVREYFTVENIRSMFGECHFSQDELDKMAEAVVENRWHMTIWQAWIGGDLMGEGATKEDAIENAVNEYEQNVGYGDWPQFPNREALIKALDVGLKNEQPSP